MIRKIVGGLMLFPGGVLMLQIGPMIGLHPVSPWIVLPWVTVAGILLGLHKD